MSGPRILLTTLSVRQSAKGNAYLSGWLGKASVVAFAGEPDKFGNPTWNLFLCQPEPREGGQAPVRKPQEREAPSAQATEPASAGTRPASSYRAPRRESQRARQDRAAREAIARYGGAELNDKIPF